MQVLNSAILPLRREPTILVLVGSSKEGTGIVRLACLSLALAAALPLHASALGKVERCEGLAAIHRAALDLFDEGVPREDAIQALLEANAAADPYLVESVKSVVDTAYARGAANRGEKAQQIYTEICLSI